MSGLSVTLRKGLPGFELAIEWSIGEELAVLFGPSGAGKSLTLRMIAGLVRPDAGSVRSGERVLFDSAGVVDLPPECRSLGYVFQDLALFPHMTVLENIRYGGHGLPREVRSDRAAAMIERFRLGGLEQRRPAEISGGQRQRVAFARALLRRPGALLLDEPFSALDASSRREMGRLLREVQREFGLPVVLVTHDAAEAASLADTVILCAGGRVIRRGAPQEVLTARPRGAATPAAR